MYAAATMNAAAVAAAARHPVSVLNFTILSQQNFIRHVLVVELLF